MLTELERDISELTVLCPSCDYPAQIHGPLTLPLLRILEGMTCHNCGENRDAALLSYVQRIKDRYGNLFVLS